MNVYYIFNHKRFSYPAAYGQSTVQKKSCGTWKLGFIYSHQALDFDYSRLPSSLITGGNNGVGLYDELKFNEINYYDYSINFGYAYNWVFAPNLLCSVSIAPAVGYKFAKGESFESRHIIQAQYIQLRRYWKNGAGLEHKQIFHGYIGGGTRI